MREYLIYLYLKQIIDSLTDSQYSFGYNNLRLERDNYISIYIRSQDPSGYRVLRSGQYYNTRQRVQVLIQSGLSDESYMEQQVLATQIFDTFSLLNNKFFEIDIPDKLNKHIQGDKVSGVITLTTPLGSVQFDRRTTQGRVIQSLNFIIEYNLEV